MSAFRKNFLYSFFAVFTLSFLLFVTGCEKKVDEPKQVEQPVVEQEQPPVEEAAEPMLTGTWKGTFNKRSCTLKITEQDGLNFKGDIVINYRDVVRQQVSGSFDPEKLTFKMSDQIRSREAGNYSGTLTEDLMTMKGTFSVRADEQKTYVSFELKLQ